MIQRQNELFSGTLSHDGIISNEKVLTAECPPEFHSPENPWRTAVRYILDGAVGWDECMWREPRRQEHQRKHIEAVIGRNPVLAAAMLAQALEQPPQP